MKILLFLCLTIGGYACNTQTINKNNSHSSINKSERDKSAISKIVSDSTVDKFYTNKSKLELIDSSSLKLYDLYENFQDFNIKEFVKLELINETVYNNPITQ